MLDIFNNDAFSVLSLSDAINKLKFMPGRINQMGLFSETSLSTKWAAIEQRDGVLALIGKTPRGGPGHTLPKPARVARALEVPHFEVNDAVMAEEVQGIRAFGSETAMETLQERVMERLLAARQSLEVTHEYARLGAVKGIITYPGGETLDLFDEFDVEQPAEVGFNLSAATPTSGALRSAIAAVQRTIATNLGGTPYAGIHAFCGDAFFDALLAHVEVRNTFLNHPGAAALRAAYIQNGMSYGTFEFGGVTWENYKGGVGATQFIETDVCYLFPTGVPGLFRTYYAPADYNNTVNRPGQRLVVFQKEMDNEKGIRLDTQMNALDVVTRPNVLIKGRRTA